MQRGCDCARCFCIYHASLIFSLCAPFPGAQSGATPSGGLHGHHASRPRNEPRHASVMVLEENMGSQLHTLLSLMARGGALVGMTRGARREAMQCHVVHTCAHTTVKAHCRSRRSLSNRPTWEDVRSHISGTAWSCVCGLHRLPVAPYAVALQP